MEESLTRTEIIAQLKERYLQVSFLEGLSLEQLEKIYQEDQDFVVPKPQRQPRVRSVPAPNPHPQPLPVDVEVDHLTQRIKTTAMLGQKRRLPEQSSADDKVKQIKMDLQ